MSFSISFQIVVRLYVVGNKRPNRWANSILFPQLGRAQFQHNARMSRYEDGTGDHAPNAVATSAAAVPYETRPLMMGRDWRALNTTLGVIKIRKDSPD